MNAITRRRFIGSSVSLAGLGLLPRSFAVGPPAKNPIGFGTYGLPGYSLGDAIDLVAKAGFDSIEIATMPGSHGAPDQLSAAQRQDARKRMGDSGLILGALMGLPVPAENKAVHNAAELEQRLELAHELSPGKPPLIQGILGGGKWEEKKALFRDSLGPWVETASKAGITLAIKPHRSNAMSLPEQGIWLIEQLGGTDHLKLCYDPSHFAFRGLDLAETVAESLPYTAYLVLKDAVMIDGKVRFRLPGEAGSIPHAEVLQQFMAGGYEGEICAEVSGHVSKADDYDPVAAAEISLSNLREIASASDESDYVSIFDGRTFEGWDSKPGSWEIREGEIWCTGKAKEKNWLIWRGGEPADFVLRMDFRWDHGNSGVQVRSDDLGDWMIFGYQVEVAKQEVMGLWHHSLLPKDHARREERHLMALAGEEVVIIEDGSRTKQQVQDGDSVKAQYREHDWNTLEIVARGDTLVQKINGVVFSVVTDRDSEMSRKKGFIALQDHGKGCQVAFRNIRLKQEG